MQLLVRAQGKVLLLKGSHENLALLEKIIIVLVREGQWKRAEEVALGIEESPYRARALSELVKALSQAGQWERAEKVAQGIEENSYRVEALRELAKGLSQAEQWGRVEEVGHCIKLLQLIQRYWSLAETMLYNCFLWLMA